MSEKLNVVYYDLSADLILYTLIISQILTRYH